MRLIFICLISVICTTGYAAACSKPMSQSQLQRVTEMFNQMAPDGDGFKIDHCRNITIRYGDDKKTGRLHQLFTQLNHSHHDTTYFGLIDDGEWWVYGSGGEIYLYHPNKTKQQSADWMVDMNARIVRLLKLAGYDNDPQADKRAGILERDLEELGTPDFGEAIGGLLSIIAKNSPSGHQSVSKSQCEANKKSCKSQCQGLSNRLPDVFSSSPRSSCTWECNSITCY